METNKLIFAGTHERVWVVELEEGDITVFGEIVEWVERVTDSRTVVHMVGGQTLGYGRATSTIIIERR